MFNPGLNVGEWDLAPKMYAPCCLGDKNDYGDK